MTKWSANDKKYAPRQCLKHLQYNIDKWIGQQPIMFPVIHKRAFVVSTCCARIRPCLSEAQLFKEALRDFSSSLILESRFLDFLLKKYTIIDQNSKNYKKESNTHTHTKKKETHKKKSNIHTRKCSGGGESCECEGYGGSEPFGFCTVTHEFSLTLWKLNECQNSFFGGSGVGFCFLTKVLGWVSVTVYRLKQSVRLGSVLPQPEKSIWTY